MMRVGFNSKLTSKNSKTKKRKNAVVFTKLLFISFVFLLLIGGIVGTVYGIKKWMKCCPYFYVSSVKVDGNKKISTIEILKLSGIKEGDNIFAINLQKVRNQILENPWIKDVSIERRLPDSIHIHINERTPLGLIQINQRIYMVDSTGTPFKPLLPEDSFSAPIITGVETGKIAVSDVKNLNALIDHSKVADALKIIKMSQKGVRALGFNNISQIYFPDDNTIVIYTADKAIPFYLDRNKLVKQFYRAEKILIQLYNSGQYQKVLSVNVGYGKDMALAKLKSK